MEGTHRDTDLARLAGRVQRLHAELMGEGVPVIDQEAFPTPLHQAWPRALDLLCEEIAYSRYVQVHEGFRPSYGCLIVPDLEAIRPESSILLGVVSSTVDSSAMHSTGQHTTSPDLDERTSRDDMAGLRMLIDGVQTFLVRDLHGRSGFGTIRSASDELMLVELNRELNGICVRRLLDSRIQLLMNSLVCTNDGYDWRWLTTSQHVLPRLISRLQPPDEHVDDLAGHLSELLDLCVHLLSPRGIGATFVWQACGPGSAGKLSNQPTQPAASLNVFRKQDRSPIVSLLASADGACFISREGAVLNYWSMLDPSSIAKQLIAEQGGTRHTSAKRYSYDEPGSLVIVVSADGPVTIFSDGAQLARLDDATHQSGKPWITQLPLHEGAQVRNQEQALTCPRCEKQLLVSVDIHPAYSDSVSISCPICKASELVRYDNVVCSHTRVIKLWAPLHD